MIEILNLWPQVQKWAVYSGQKWWWKWTPQGKQFFSLWLRRAIIKQVDTYPGIYSSGLWTEKQFYDTTTICIKKHSFKDATETKFAHKLTILAGLSRKYPWFSCISYQLQNID